MHCPSPRLMACAIAFLLGSVVGAQAIAPPADCQDVSKLASGDPAFAVVAQNDFKAIVTAVPPQTTKQTCDRLRALENELSAVGSVADYCQMTQPSTGLTVSPYRAVVDAAMSVQRDTQKQQRGLRCSALQ